MLSALAYLIVILSVVVLLISIALRISYRAPRDASRHTPADEGIAYQDFTLTTDKGNTLRGWLLPQQQRSPTIIILHGWGASASLMLPLAVPLYHQGYNILLFDARNHGRSDAEGQSSLPRFAEDLHKAIAYVQSLPRQHNGQTILIGHSVGAGAVLYEASKRNDIAAVISLSAFANPEWLMRRQMQNLKLPGFIIRAVLMHIQWLIGVRYEEIAPMNTACRISCPVLLIHGDADKMVPISDAYTIRDHCRDHALPLLIIKGAGHNASNKIRYHLDDLSQFLERAGVKPVEALSDNQ